MAKKLIKSNLSHKSKRKLESYQLFLMALPFIILVVIFAYGPLVGWVYAFFDYRPPIKLLDTEFVGFKWFVSLFSTSVQRKAILEVLRNTFAISGMNIIASVIPVFFAILLSEIRSVKFQKVVQTLTTIPNFVSWIIIYSIVFSMLSQEGVFNTLLSGLGIIKEPVNWLASDNHTWLFMVFLSTWKTLGWNAIIYIAAIAGIDNEIKEAAAVDGAGRLKIIQHVIIPGLMPTFFVLLLLSVANFLTNGMDQYFLFQNAFNKDHIQVLDLYVYNIGVGGSSYSFAIAISMLKSFISLTLLFSVNGLSKLIRGESIV